MTTTTDTTPLQDELVAIEDLVDQARDAMANGRDGDLVRAVVHLHTHAAMALHYVATQP